MLNINPLNAELNPIRHLLTLLGARHIVHVSRIGVKGVCILALVTAHEICIFPKQHYVFMCGLLAVPYFSTLSHKMYNLGKLIKYEMCVLVFSTFSKTFLILRGI